MPGTLTLCATPIGNLDDAPPRLRDALRAADLVYAEDTRRSRVLLDRLGVDVPLRSFFVGNESERAEEMRGRLEGGDQIVLLTDAGTPGVSDPGVTAVRAAVDVGAAVTIVPGPSAVTAAVAVSGFGGDRFVFEGFLPRKGAERRARLEALADERRTIVVFAAPSRLDADLAALESALGADRAVVVARELTKLHEEIYRGSLGGARTHFSTGAKGEITLVVEGAVASEMTIEDALRLVDAELEAGVPLGSAVRAVASDLGMKKRRLYEAALRRDSG